jgi:hypothetical protein
MTITLPLNPQEEARLIAVASAKGLSADALVREALDRILAEEPVPDIPPSNRSTGAALVAAMQTSPLRDLNLEAVRVRQPVRGVVL